MTKTLKSLEIFYRLITEGKISNDEIKKIIEDDHTNYNKYVKRYMNTISEFLTAFHHDMRVEYDGNNYLLAHIEGRLAAAEVLTIIKIIYASRVLNKEELTLLIEHLSKLLSNEERRLVSKSIQTELVHYNGTMMGVPIIDSIYKLNQHIVNKHVLEVTYVNTFSERKQHIIRPLYLTFNEHYFYVIGIHEREFPMILRLDRIEYMHEVDKKVNIEKFQQISFAELKDRLLYMYNGEKNKVIFELNGPFMEYVYDKFPHAKLLKADYVKHQYLVEVEAVGDGIMMWMLSQGSRVKVISPFSMVEKYTNELKKMLEQYRMR